MKNLIKDSQKILVTSHMSCDQDGICSALSTKLILEKHFPEKEIEVNIESELQKNISFLKNFSQIKTEKLLEYTKNFKPNLIIFTDSSPLERFSSNPEDLKKEIEGQKIKTILIDHHKTKSDFSFHFVFNNLRSSCAEEVYHLFTKELDLTIDTEIAEVILTGMIFDTGVFVYENKNFRETANVVSDLVEMGVNIQKILTFKNIYSKKDLDMVSELNKNLVLKEGFCYSFISEDFLKQNNFSQDEYKHAYQVWVDLFLKRIEGCPWGFIVRPDGGDIYGITFRSQKGFQNVRELAEKLNGGGHDYASGAKVTADTMNNAIEIILNRIL